MIEQNAFENNEMGPLIPVDLGRMQAIQSMAQYGNDKGWSDKQELEAVSKESRGRNPKGETYTKSIVYGSSALPFILFVSPEATLGTLATGALIGGGADIAVQKSSKEPYDYMDTFFAAGVGALTQGSTAANIDINILSESNKAVVKRDNTTAAVVKAAATTTASVILEKAMNKKLPHTPINKVLIPFMSSIAIGVSSSIVEEKTKKETNSDKK